VTVADSAANISTVAGISADVTTVAGISADVTTVAANVAGVTSFAEKYRVGTDDPTTSLDEGDLFYNTTSNLLKVYNGSAWETGVTPGSGFLSASNNLSDLDDAPTALTNLGLTATAAEINYLDITTLGTSEASKAVTTDADGVTIFDGGVVEDDTSITSSTGAATINCRDGNVFSHTLTEDVTYTFSDAPASGRAFGFTLKVVQDSTARTITWPASVDWAGGEAPTLSTGSGEVDVFVFFTTDGGTTWYGFTAGQVMS
jgi:hypothetical protein